MKRSFHPTKQRSFYAGWRSFLVSLLCCLLAFQSPLHIIIIAHAEESGIVESGTQSDEKSSSNEKDSSESAKTSDQKEPANDTPVAPDESKKEEDKSPSDIPNQAGVSSEDEKSQEAKSILSSESKPEEHAKEATTESPNPCNEGTNCDGEPSTTSNQANVVNDATAMANTGSNTVQDPPVCECIQTDDVPKEEPGAEEHKPIFSAECCLTKESPTTDTSTPGQDESRTQANLPETMERQASTPEEILNDAETATKEMERFSSEAIDLIQDPASPTSVTEPVTPSEQQSGQPHASGQTADITTGDAVAVETVVNTINQTLIGQNWQDLIYNIVNYYQGDINLAEVFSQLIASMPGLGALTGDYETNNVADLQNFLTAIAQTGSNSIDGNVRNGSINTGDATAAVDLVNIVNRTIIGNNWMFVVINVFGNWEGDLILPAEYVQSVPNMAGYAQLDVTNENQASVTNEGIVQAETGSNQNNAKNASINTGEATALSQVSNTLNTNIIQNNWFYLSINNLGNWLGNIFDWYGADPTYANGETVLGYDFSTEGEASANEGSLKVVNRNYATLLNFLRVLALTGNNQIGAGVRNGSIETGDATAISNIVNLVNTNIVGNNWIFTKLNILGNWNGNVVFAYPDVAVSLETDKSTVATQESITYTIHFANEGLADAKQVGLSLQTSDGASKSWSLPDMKPGQSGTMSFTTVALNESPTEDRTIAAESTIKTDTKENQRGNNQARTSVTVLHRPVVVEEPTGPMEEPIRIGAYDLDPSLHLSRKLYSRNTIGQGDVISHAITLRNDGESAVVDIRLRDRVFQQEQQLGDFVWELGGLNSGEGLRLEYDVRVSGGASGGNYENRSVAFGTDLAGDDVKSNAASINYAVAGGWYPYAGGEDQQAPFELISSAQAAGYDNPIVEGAVMGQSFCKPLPNWIWMLALLSHGLAVNWSLFPIKKGAIAARTRRWRSIGGSIGATVAALIFWQQYHCGGDFWFLGLVMTIGCLHVLYKYRSVRTAGVAIEA